MHFSKKTFCPELYLRTGWLKFNKTECIYQNGNDANQMTSKSTCAFLGYSPLFIQNLHVVKKIPPQPYPNGLLDFNKTWHECVCG